MIIITRWKTSTIEKRWQCCCKTVHRGWESKLQYLQNYLKSIYLEEDLWAKASTPFYWMGPHILPLFPVEPCVAYSQECWYRKINKLFLYFVIYEYLTHKTRISPNLLIESFFYLHDICCGSFVSFSFKVHGSFGVWDWTILFVPIIVFNHWWDSIRVHQNVTA